MARDTHFERVFNPQALAVVGASGSDIRALPNGGFIGNFLKLGFEGHLYPVNPKFNEISGLKAYPNLVSIPEPLDLVIICTPAREVPAVLEDCIAAEVKNVHIFTAGFSECDGEYGKVLEEKIKQIAQKGGLNVVGPNCMGINVPDIKMQTLHALPINSGNVAFLSQSGGHAIQFSGYAAGFGIGFSKIISYGNGCVMDITDFLEYLVIDPETDIITLYLEGVRDGRKMTKLVREINRTKPVIIWKGGRTEGGARAVVSHTGSLAGKPEIWDAFFKQTGAVSVSSLDELADITMAFLYQAPPPGRRMGLLLGGGGRGVAASDDCNMEGLLLPALSLETRNLLNNLIPLAGNSVRNPIDAYMMLQEPALFRQVLDIVAEDQLIDIILVDLEMNMLHEVNPAIIGEMEEIMIRFAGRYSGKKSLVVLLGAQRGNPKINAERSRLRKVLSRAGIGVYRNLPRTCRALDKFITYHEFRLNSN